MTATTERIGAEPGTSADAGTIWYTRCPVPSATGVAVSRGLLRDAFAAQGRQVLSLAAAPEADAHESHFDHTRANSFRQGGNIPALWARSRGARTRLLGLSWAAQRSQIVTLRDDIRSVADLRGRRLGLSLRLNDGIDFIRASALHAFETALATAGLGLDDVRLTDIPVAEKFISDGPAHRGGDSQLWDAGLDLRMTYPTVAALIRDDVDAVYLNGPLGLSHTRFLGARPVFVFEPAGDPATLVNNLTPVALTVSADLLEHDRPAVDRYVAALVTASAWAREHPAATRTIVAREVGVAEHWVDRSGLAIAGGALDTSLAPDLVRCLRSQQEFLVRHGFVEPGLSIDDWIDPEPLARAVHTA